MTNRAKIPRNVSKIIKDNETSDKIGRLRLDADFSLVDGAFAPRKFTSPDILANRALDKIECEVVTIKRARVIARTIECLFTIVFLASIYFYFLDMSSIPELSTTAWIIIIAAYFVLLLTMLIASKRGYNNNENLLFWTAYVDNLLEVQDKNLTVDTKDNIIFWTKTTIKLIDRR